MNLESEIVTEISKGEENNVILETEKDNESFMFKKLNKQESIIILVIIAISILIGFFAFQNIGRYHDKSLYARISVINDILDEYAYYDLDKKAMEKMALRGYMLGSTDKYATYFSGEELTQEEAEMNGQYCGIGISMSLINNKATIIDVSKNGPADKSGMKIGDVITSVNGKESYTSDLNKLSKVLTDEKNKVVEVSFERKSKKYTTSIKKEIIKTETISEKILEGNIGYIKITEFTKKTSDEFDTAIKKLQNKNVKKLIIDLRDNPGGIVDSSISIADKLLPEGVLINVKAKKKSLEQVYKSDSKKLDMKYCILINENSASAAEILAASVKSYNCAEIIGKTSYGKGIIQTVVSIPYSEDALKFTIAEYMDKNNNKIHGVGVKPTIEVNNTGKEDLQLKKAIEILK